jgi:hypothetical protein
VRRLVAGGRCPAGGAQSLEPFIVLTLLVGDWGIKPVRALLEHVSLGFFLSSMPSRGRIGSDCRTVPFNWLSATGPPF